METRAAHDPPFEHADLDGRPPSQSTTVLKAPPRAAGDDPGARAIAALRRAWLRDDQDDVERARRDRAEAAWFLRMAVRDGTRVNRHVCADLALLADLLRRSGDHGGAVAVALRGLAAGPPDGVGSLLLFQLRLARAGDEGRHDIGEALSGQFDESAAGDAR